MHSIYFENLLAPAEKPAEPIEQAELFYEFLRGNAPDGIKANRMEQPKLSPRQAFAVIWFLQEKLGLLPDNIEQCCSCKELFDADSEGYYIESVYRHYCDNCLPIRYRR